MGRRLIAVGLAAAFLAVVAAWTLLPMRGLGRTVAPWMAIQTTPVIALRSSDDRGTDAMATISNPNPTPVDVAIRARGFDVTGRPCLERTVGPFRGVPTGGSRPIQLHLDATPLESVTFEAIAVNPVGLDRP